MVRKSGVLNEFPVGHIHRRARRRRCSSSLNAHCLSTYPIILKHLQRIHSPIRLRKRSRIITNILLTRRRQTRTLARIPRIPRPIATERCIEHDLKILEVVVHVEIAAEYRRRRTPILARRGASTRDVRGEFTAGEEPDLDGGVGPLCGVDAAAVSVEGVAEGEVCGVGDGAAGVFGLVGGVDVAVCCDEFAGEDVVLGRFGYAGAGVGVQGHLV